MIKSIQLRLIILVAVIFILSMITVNLIVAWEYQARYRDVLQDRGRVAASELMYHVEYLRTLGLNLTELSNFDQLCTDIVRKYENVTHAMVTDTKGNILYRSHPFPAGLNTLDGAMESTGLLGGKHWLASYPVLDEQGQPRGYAVIAVDTNAIDKVVGEFLLSALLYGILIIIASLVFLAVVLRQHFGKPAQELLSHIDNLHSGGDITAHNGLIYRNDEIGSIAKSFYSLFQRLIASQSNLRIHGEQLEKRVIERTEELRRTNRELEADIARRKLLEKQLERLAHTDDLTGLSNRAYFMASYNQRVEHAKRHHRPLAVLLMDLNKFKDINDHYGHAEGDRVLEVIAGRLRDICRSGDILARLGGDEFVLLLEDFQLAEDIVHVIKKIGSSVNEPIVRANASYNIGVSIGVAVLGKEENGSEELLKVADKAMYKAKHEEKLYCFAPDNLYEVACDEQEAG